MGPKRVVVIDDDQDFLNIIEHRLKILGAKSYLFLNSNDFLKALKDINPDLILLDLDLVKPKEGLVLIEAIRKFYTTPILVMSADENPKIVAHALELGAQDYLVKPIYKPLFEEKVGHFLGFDAQKWPESSRVIPSDFRNAKVHLNFELESLSENRVVIRSNVLIKKMTRINLNSTIFDSICGRSEMIGSVLSSYILNDLYYHEVELDLSDEEYSKFRYFYKLLH